MSLFQCENCGCVENTSLTGPINPETGKSCKIAESYYSYEGEENKRGMALCSECGPSRYSDGTNSGCGKWHGQFDKMYLPMNQFETDERGNLRHIRSGSTDYRAFEIGVEFK